VATGFAFLPIAFAMAASANLSTIVLMPRVGPKAIIPVGMLIAAGAMTWFARLGVHTSYGSGVVGPLMLTGFGLGMVIAPSINTGTFGVARRDAGVASATVNVGQQLGASIGTSLLNTIFAGAVTAYITVHIAAAGGHLTGTLTGLSLAHGYDTAFWWVAGILAGGAVISALLLRAGPLRTDPAITVAPAGGTAELHEAVPPPISA
jgi:hypothetical protein